VEPVRILVIDDDVRHADSVSHLLSSPEHAVTVEARPEAGFRLLQNQRFDILLLDLNMPGLTGLDILQRVQPARRGIKTIVISGERDIATVAPILRLGAFDYLSKPYAPEHLLTSVRNAQAQVRLERENASIQAQREAMNRTHAFLVNSSPDLIYILDREGRFTFINNQLTHVFGYAQDDLIGNHWTKLFPDPKLHDVVQFRIDDRRTGDRATRHFEFDYSDAHDRRHVIELSAMGLYETVADKPSFVGTYGIVRDVTEARRTARVLMQSQQKFYGLFMNSPDAVFISRLDDGQLIEANDNFATMIAELAPGDVTSDAAIWGSAATRAQFVSDLDRSPRRAQFLLERELPDGPRCFEITARRLSLDHAECMMATLRDLTAQKQAERDRLHLETQLQQSSKMEAIGQLAGGIAHDFNNILASIIGYTELALVSLPDEPPGVASYLNEVVAAGQRARDLISQMLTFTRAHRGRPELTPLSTSVTEVSRMLRAAIPRTIDIDTVMADDLPPVLIDPIQLQQIVINLLINARDAIDGHGRILVGASCAERSGVCVACSSAYEGRYVMLTVADTGHGIPEALHKKIFDMFVSTREPDRGTGIGLWLIDTIVHEYDGHIGLESGPSGTKFHVLLPVTARLAQPAQAPPPKSLIAPAVRGQGRIIVVDDELSVANFVSEVLRSAGYDVRVFNDSDAARAHIRRHPEQISLVLTDQSMPQVTGFEIAEAARQSDPAVPVVILTGLADNIDAGKLAQQGVAQLIPKPFRIEALLNAVRAHIRRGDTTVSVTDSDTVQ
jgi:PAS domain S-box-containing protein